MVKWNFIWWKYFHRFNLSSRKCWFFPLKTLDQKSENVLNCNFFNAWKITFKSFRLLYIFEEEKISDFCQPIDQFGLAGIQRRCDRDSFSTIQSYLSADKWSAAIDTRTTKLAIVVVKTRFIYCFVRFN